MEETTCIFCKIPSDHVVIEENGYKGKQCPQCGLIHISPRPSWEDIENLYGHDHAHVSAESHISNAYPKRLHARHHLRILRSFEKVGDLLEIGAGAGYFLDEARTLGFSPYGLEFNPIQASFIRSALNIPCEQSALNTSIFAGRKFDVVYHCDVISHFFDPISEFRKTNAVMRERSYLVFETGNFGEVDPIHFKHIPRFQYPDHLFFFNTDNLIRLLDETGFEFVRLYRYSIVPELLTLRILFGARELARSPAGKSEGRPVPPSDERPLNELPAALPDSVNSPSAFRKCIRNASSYFNYVLRYKIGRIAPKPGRPQTMIVIAKKKSG